MNKSDSMDIYDRLQKAINVLAPTPNELIEQLYSICVERRMSKGERFVEAGGIPKYMGLNLGGLFRFYYSDEKGNDFTKGFNKANQFLISYSAIVQKRPSYFNIEAIQNSRILVFEYEHFNEMIQSDIRWYPFIFKLLESVYIMKELREKSFLLDDASKRYQEFREQYAEVEDQIKLYHVASFLGITPEALSRIRNPKN
jgi:CRP-like cAMP-binding protein